MQSPYLLHLNETLRMIAGTDSLSLLIDYAADHSGYVRQAVLSRCAELARPEFLPVVADRLNDWVPQVREAARNALLALLPAVPATQLMAILPVILRLHSAGRGDYADWLGSFEQTLLRTITMEDVLAAAHDTNLKVTRAAVHLLDKYRLIEPSSLIELMVRRSDDIVLAVRGVEMCGQLAPAAQVRLYRAAAASHFGAVRTIAIDKLLSMRDEAHIDTATAALMDMQSSVRQVAIRHFGTAGFDAVDHYRSTLQRQALSAKNIRVCLIALASLRDLASLELIQSFQHHEHAQVRAVSLAAWFKLNERDKDAIALAALHDNARGIRKLAVSLVRKHGAYIPFAVVAPLLAHSDDAALLLRLVESKKWDWLECVVRLCLQRGAGEALRQGGDDAFGDWLRGADWYDTPRQEQVLFLTSAPAIDALRTLLASRPQHLAGVLRRVQQLAL